MGGLQAVKERATYETADEQPPKRPKGHNVGGSSELAWFNPLASDPQLRGVRDHLAAKISAVAASALGCGGCVKVVGFNENTRPVANAAEMRLLKTVCPSAPARFSPYVISMAKAGMLLPDRPPPPYPAELRHVKHKRTAAAAEGNEKGATWVASHRCHNRECVNAERLVWEPSWFNRLRDNCPGGEACGHRPHPCLASHRPAGGIVDWTVYDVGGVGEEEAEA